jgi:hypothetical protein
MLQKDTLKGPACWVCGVRFKTSVPPGPANREDHHIFPRNAGGTDGPEVSLCDSHHADLHKVALRLQAKKPFQDLLIGASSDQQKKILWLATMVVKAEKYAENDPNKLLRNGVQLNPFETQMILRLQKVTGKSRSDLLRAGLYLLFKKHFPSR